MSWSCEVCGKGRYADHSTCQVSSSIDAQGDTLVEIRDLLKEILAELKKI